MPKKARSPEEVQKIREEILDKTLELINEVGFDNFTMRKLAGKLGLTATTIYQYYKNKEELYFAALTQGFDTLCDVVQEALGKQNDPKERLREVIRAIIRFSLAHPNVYNILFVSDVPKYYDYVGTESEAVAKNELDAAMRFRNLLISTVLQSGIIKADSENDVLMDLIAGICTIHGYIVFVNSQITDYLLGPDTQTDSDEMVNKLIDTVFAKYG
ncbi:MAG: TetR/AcrR family transcriptional regulator [Clostridia bacterium]|nr:TetR/AcrR family transcriptional regulator [Clostridia bacterium]MBQ2500271.1 TetR/AcrR family transcriptional regulator [Clostridia bacterium]MBQ3897095.1 TetR/AcrR family transcriptional regulator [Clostridia bacterium]